MRQRSRDDNPVEEVTMFPTYRPGPLHDRARCRQDTNVARAESRDHIRIEIILNLRPFPPPTFIRDLV